jgi:hypothetical protein
LIELTQVRRRHAHVTHRWGTIRQIQGRRRRGRRRSAADTQQEGFHVVARFAAAGFDGALHDVERMVGQQLQDTHIVLGAAARSMLALQRRPQFTEHGGQLPASEHVRMIQGGGATRQRVQVVTRVEHLRVRGVRTRVRRNHLITVHDVDALDIRLDRDGLEGRRTRHAIAVAVATHHLVLVHLGRLVQAGIEGAARQ